MRIIQLAEEKAALSSYFILRWKLVTSISGFILLS